MSITTCVQVFGISAFSKGIIVGRLSSRPGGRLKEQQTTEGGTRGANLEDARNPTSPIHHTTLPTARPNSYSANVLNGPMDSRSQSGIQ